MDQVYARVGHVNRKDASADATNSAALWPGFNREQKARTAHLPRDYVERS